jgi:hypothetical protein
MLLSTDVPAQLLLCSSSMMLSKYVPPPSLPHAALYVSIPFCSLFSNNVPPATLLVPSPFCSLMIFLLHIDF